MILDNTVLDNTVHDNTILDNSGMCLISLNIFSNFTFDIYFVL